MNDALSIASLCLSIATLVLLVPLYGKAFFSTHTREYMPIEEYTKIRKDLGLEKPDDLEQAETAAQDIGAKLFGVKKESFKPLSYFQPRVRKSPEAGNKEKPLRG